MYAFENDLGRIDNKNYKSTSNSNANATNIKNKIKQIKLQDHQNELSKSQNNLSNNYYYSLYLPSITASIKKYNQ